VRRALRLGVVDRIEEVVAGEAIRHSAGQLRVQLGESILPLAGVGADGNLDGKVRVFRLNDGSHEIGYAFREVIDLVSIANEVIPAEMPGAVSGVTLIDGEPAELVDAHWLFAEHLGAAIRPAVQLVCRLPEGDAWMQNMLRPIVEAAGYLVIGENDELGADITIVSEGRDVSSAQGGRVLRLASDPDAADGQDRIYRYDRAGLLIALKSASAGRR
jgi:two-component system chemotaxis sensor kinase CheA